jgi:hypothetical protein
MIEALTELGTLCEIVGARTELGATGETAARAD